MLVSSKKAIELAKIFCRQRYGYVTAKTDEIELYVRSAIINFAEYVKSECEHSEFASPYLLHKYVKSLPVVSMDWFKYCAPALADFINPDK